MEARFHAGRSLFTVAKVLAGLAALIGLLALAWPSASFGAEREEARTVHTAKEVQSLGRAIHLVFDGFLEEAEAEFRALLARAPEDPVGFFYAAMVNYQRLRRDGEDESSVQAFYDLMGEAIRLADLRLRKDAGDALAHFYRGGGYGFRAQVDVERRRFLKAIGDSRRGVQSLKEAVRLRPETWDAYLGLGMYHYFVDVLPPAMKLVRPLLFLPPGDRVRGLRELHLAIERGTLAAPMARFTLMDIYARFEGRPDEALSHARKLVEAFPHNPYFRLHLGFHLLRRLKRPDEAAETFDEVLRQALLGASNFDLRVMNLARFGLAQSHRERKDWEGARSHGEALLGSAPLAPRYLRPLGQILLGDYHAVKGERARALEFYERAARETAIGEVDWEARAMGFPTWGAIRETAQDRLIGLKSSQEP